jgi:hypothetical protein
MNLYFVHQRMAKKFVKDFKNTGFEARIYIKQEVKHLLMFINFRDNLGLMLLLLIHET